MAADVKTTTTAAAHATAETKYVPTNGEAGAGAEARAQASLEARRQEVERRASRVSSKARARTETALNASAIEVEQEAAEAEHAVASRLAAEFDASAAAMVEQKSQLGVTWGDLMIAHTLASNVNSAGGFDQLIELKKSGLGWGTLAAGFNLDLHSVVASVKAEQQVALGRAAADGKVAVIRADGVRTGLGANADLGASAGRAGNTSLGGNAGLGAGAGVGNAGSITTVGAGLGGIGR